jgi:hypothetical protein
MAGLKPRPANSSGAQKPRPTKIGVPPRALLFACHYKILHAEHRKGKRRVQWYVRVDFFLGRRVFTR